MDVIVVNFVVVVVVLLVVEVCEVVLLVDEDVTESVICILSALIQVSWS